VGLTVAPDSPARLPAAQAAATICPKPGGAKLPTPALPVSSDLMVVGHGWGHSLGMSQYGAQGAALLGCSASQILTTYYTGAKIVAPTLKGRVVLTLLTNGSSATVHSQTGALAWSSPGSKATHTQSNGVTWTVTRSGKNAVVRNSAGQVMWTMAPGQEVRAAENGIVATVHGSGGSALPAFQTRWDYTSFVMTSTGLQMRQTLVDNSHGKAVQKYLYGVDEVPASWPTQALRAQAIAARTYLAARYDATYGGYVIGTTSATQVNNGYAREAADVKGGGRWKAAVDATLDTVLEDKAGHLITAMFTSSSGGHSEDYAYVYGTTGFGYLKGIDDSRWDLASSNPYRTWTAGYTWADLAKRFKMDSVANIILAPQGSSARDAGATVYGSIAGKPAAKHYSGSALKSILGTRSPGLTFERAPQPLVGDFNGDGKTDVGWYYDNTVDLLIKGKRVTYRLGYPGDVAVVGDWNGDGKDDIGIFRQGRWYLCTYLGGACGSGFMYGNAGDTPVVGRWPGSKVASIGVVRGNHWLLRKTPTTGPVQVSFTFGLPTDRPLVGDWNGDGYDTPGRQSGQTWYWTNSLVPAGVAHTIYGRTTDVAIPGDWDGNKTSTFGVARAGRSFLVTNHLTGDLHAATINFVP
jgi:stage II sporulation protein D